MEIFETIENYAKKKITLYKERDEVQRSAFKERISSIDPSTIVYIDESGVDNRIFRAYGRAPRGEQVYGNINGSRKRRFSVIGGLMNRTFIATSTFEGSCNSDVFNAWLEHVLILSHYPTWVAL